MRRLILLSLATCLLYATSFAMPPMAERALQQSLAENAEVAERGRQRLRQMGPAGLDRLIVHRNALVSSGAPADSPEMLRVNDAIDTVGGAKYCTASRLYWYTDFDRAKAAAEREKKPILSLRMLGNLSDDLSCANSRFFRTTLYANEQISDLLRENFVLHWKSVRPVPKITIDFGDGRKLERTITGNSAHYVLLADGTVVDCLPGLYGPQAFQAKLSALLKVVQATPTEAAERQKYLVAFHAAEEQSILRDWQADLTKLGISVAMVNNANAARNREALHVKAIGQKQSQQQRAAAPAADEAAFIARPKSRIELPAIAAFVRRDTSLEQATTEKVWEQLATLHRDDARLDEASRALIASHSPTAAVAARVAITKSITESPLVKMLRGLEEAVAVDSVRNEYELHRKLHRWFVEGSASYDIDLLNERVYAELFLTPRSDPWLGLGPGEAYAALPNNGVVQNEQEGENR